VTALAHLSDSLRGGFILARHRLDIAQDWLLKHSDSLVQCKRPPYISATIEPESTQISVHMPFETRSQALTFAKYLNLSREMDEGSNHFDIEYDRFTAHLHFSSHI
jgi:hypothetical protein